MRPSIVVVGSLNMDLVIRVQRHPVPGETLLGGQFATYPGGKGANQAVAAARLGCAVELVGRVGADAFGEELLRRAAGDGVNTTFVHKDPQAATGAALITLDAAGQNTIVVAQGANGQVSTEDIYEAEPAFVRASLLLAQLELPLPAIQAAVQMARYHGALVVINPSPAPTQPLPPGLLEGIDFLIPNQYELAILSGVAGLEEGIERLQGLGVRTLVVTLGGDGLLLAQGKRRLHIPAHPMTVVDTVAAGDAFVAAFAAALVEGRPVEDACCWGNAAGAIAVTRHGAQPSLPFRAEVEQFCSMKPD